MVPSIIVLCTKTSGLLASTLARTFGTGHYTPSTLRSTDTTPLRRTAFQSAASRTLHPTPQPQLLLVSLFLYFLDKKPRIKLPWFLN